MIILFCEGIIGIIIGLFTYVLGALNWSFPSQIISAFGVFMSVVDILGTFLPFVGAIVAIFLIIVPTAVIRYVFDMMLWLWGLVPFIGSRSGVPGGGNHLDLRRSARPGELDLRHSQPKPRKKLADITRRGE